MFIPHVGELATCTLLNYYLCPIFIPINWKQPLKHKLIFTFLWTSKRMTSVPKKESAPYKEKVFYI